MPRDVPLGNGSLLIAFDGNYQIRDLYWPHVGEENHAMGHPFRVGVWTEGTFKWFDDEGWKRSLHYLDQSLTGQAHLAHQDLQVDLQVTDAVDFHENLLIRKFEIHNAADHDREIRLFLHHDFHISGNEVGDTCYYEPDRKAVIHYKAARWFLINGAVVLEKGDSGPGWAPTADTAPGIVVGLHQWACGLKEIRNLQGTWRDAEDGSLSGEVVAHGSVDSCVGFNLHVPAGGVRVLYAWLAVGEDFEAIRVLNHMVRQRGPQSFLDRTLGYWPLWLKTHLPDLTALPPHVSSTYETSLLVIRTQVDSGGAVIAANDSDISSDVRDTYSYMWPRDGALVTAALTEAGYVDIPRSFFRFCTKVLAREGYLLHKYNPDGTLASSWHPWMRDGHKNVPLQEDETALVLWALWRHFAKFGDVEFIKPLYRPLVISAGDFLVRYRDPQTHLPLPSYDLWEERFGVHTWTVAATWAGLTAAAQFAGAFQDAANAARYAQAADEVKAAAEAHLWRPKAGSFVRMLYQDQDGAWQDDSTLDASTIGVWKFGMIPPEDPKSVATMQAIKDRLWVKTKVGGLARYENDRYHQVSQDVDNVPGNPWFICTLWLSEWHSATANVPDDLQPAKDLLVWAADRALPSGVLAEQINPYDDSPLSVSPLTWSHAAFVSAAHAYIEADKRVSS